MKIPSDATISREKLTSYLLIFKEVDDKSKFLEQAGFTQANPDALETAIRKQSVEGEVEQDRVNRFGMFYRVMGDLVGVNGRILKVITVWVQDPGTQHFRFITLKPWRQISDET